MLRSYLQKIKKNIQELNETEEDKIINKSLETQINLLYEIFKDHGTTDKEFEILKECIVRANYDVKKKA